MGLAEDAFWQLTMMELDVLCRRQRARERKWELYLAQIPCQIYNVNRGKDDPAGKIEDFMVRETKVPRKQTLAEMMQVARMITAALGGEIK